MCRATTWGRKSKDWHVMPAPSAGPARTKWAPRCATRGWSEIASRQRSMRRALLREQQAALAYLLSRLSGGSGHGRVGSRARPPRPIPCAARWGLTPSVCAAEDTRRRLAPPARRSRSHGRLRGVPVGRSTRRPDLLRTDRAPPERPGGARHGRRSAGHVRRSQSAARWAISWRTSMRRSRFAATSRACCA